MKKKKKNKIDRQSMNENFQYLLLSLPIYILYKDYGGGSRKRIPEFDEKMQHLLKMVEIGEIPVSSILDVYTEVTGEGIE